MNPRFAENNKNLMFKIPIQFFKSFSLDANKSSYLNRGVNRDLSPLLRFKKNCKLIGQHAQVPFTFEYQWLTWIFGAVIDRTGKWLTSSAVLFITHEKSEGARWGFLHWKAE